MQRMIISFFTILALTVSATALAGSGNEQVIDYQAIEKKMSRTVEDIKTFTLKQKDRATEKASQAISALDKDIVQMEKTLQEQAGEMSAATRQEKQEALSALREQRAELKRAYTEMKQQSGEAWDDARERFEDAYRQARDEWRDLAS